MTDTTVNENDLGTTVEEPVVLSEEEQATEAQARRMGWRPKEEFARPPERWVDAKTFVERGMTELPVLRDRYRKLDGQLATVSKELAEVKTTNAEQQRVLLELREMTKNAEDRAYIRAVRELTQRERDAVAAADTAAYDAIQRERQDLEQHRPRVTVEAPPVRTEAPTVQQPAPQSNPEVEAWIQANPWFKNDRILNQVAIAFDAEVKEEHPDWSVGEQLAEAKARVVARFPEKFANARRTAPAAVLTSNNSPAPKRGKSIKDLPREFQDAFARFQKQMPGYTEAEYLNTLGET